MRQDDGDVEGGKSGGCLYTREEEGDAVCEQPSGMQVQTLGIQTLNTSAKAKP